MEPFDLNTLPDPATLPAPDADEGVEGDTGEPYGDPTKESN